MTTDWALILPFSGIVVLAGLLFLRLQSGQSPRQIGQAARDCALLLRLLGLLQQHRGASAALVSGDHSFAERRRTLQGEIDGLWPAITEAARRETAQARPCFTVNEWAVFQHKWGKLIEGLGQSSAADLIHLHTQMISRLLDWLAALGEARIEAVAGRQLPTGLVSDYVHRLPALAECLGQARALGTSVAVTGQCSPVARVRLGFLIARAESLLLATRRSDRPRSAERAQLAVEELLAMLRKHILDGGRVSVGAQDYFAAATRAIDAVFGWIGSHGETLQDLSDSDSGPATTSGRMRGAIA